MEICFFLHSIILHFVEVPKFCFQVCPVSCYPSHLRSVSAPRAWVTAHLAPSAPAPTQGGGGGRGKYGAGHVTLRHIWFLASLSSLTCSLHLITSTFQQGKVEIS